MNWGRQRRCRRRLLAAGAALAALVTAQAEPEPPPRQPHGAPQYIVQWGSTPSIVQDVRLAEGTGSPTWLSEGVLQVMVLGEGADAVAARQDAMRQALQRLVPQLVTVERRIADDKLLRDDVLTSMNGLVERFDTVFAARKNGGSHVVVASVQVRRSELGEFLRTARMGPASAFHGETIFSESLREQAQRDFRGRFLARAWRGYPVHAVAVALEKVVPAENDPAIIDIFYQYRLRPEFLRSLRAAAELMSCDVRAEAPCSMHVMCFPPDITGLPAYRALPRLPLWRPYSEQQAADCFGLAAGPWTRGGYPILASGLFGQVPVPEGPRLHLPHPYGGKPEDPNFWGLNFGVALRFQGGASERLSARECFDVASLGAPAGGPQPPYTVRVINSMHVLTFGTQALRGWARLSAARVDELVRPARSLNLWPVLVAGSSAKVSVVFDVADGAGVLRRRGDPGFALARTGNPAFTCPEPDPGARSP